MLKKIKEKIDSVSNATKIKAFSVGSGVGAFLVPIAAHAADSTGLDANTTAALTSGFSNATAAIAVVVAMGVGACVTVIATSGGAKAGLKWVKGAFAKAS